MSSRIIGSPRVGGRGVLERSIQGNRPAPQRSCRGPAAAAREFAAAHPEFVLERPVPLFASDADNDTLTYFPDAWLKRASPAV